MGKGVTMLLCFVIASAISAADVTATVSSDRRDVDALLCFKTAIQSDPFGSLSNWTEKNAEKVCSWKGIWCRKQTRRVLDLRGKVFGARGKVLGAGFTPEESLA